MKILRSVFGLPGVRKTRRINTAQLAGHCSCICLLYTSLDEPAAGMNPNETKELMETIHFVRDEFDMTVLLIEHDMKLVSGICEELTVLNFGQVLAQGKTSDVLNDPQVIKAYLGE